MMESAPRFRNRIAVRTGHVGSQAAHLGFKQTPKAQGHSARFPVVTNIKHRFGLGLLK